MTTDNRIWAEVFVGTQMHDINTNTVTLYMRNPVKSFISASRSFTNLLSFSLCACFLSSINRFSNQFPGGFTFTQMARGRVFSRLLSLIAFGSGSPQVTVPVIQPMTHESLKRCL